MKMMSNSSFPNLCKGTMFLPLLFLIFFPLVLCKPQWSICDNSSTYKEGSAYYLNMNKVINDVIHNAPQSSGFNTSSSGQSPNKVYALLQCMADISATECSSCAIDANKSVQTICEHDIGGRVWMGNCILRYYNSNFIGALDANFFRLIKTKNVTQVHLNASRVASFDLLSTMIDKASLPGSMRFFSGKSEYSSTVGGRKASGEVYGVAQCNNDIVIDDCRKCLLQAKVNLESNYTVQGAQATSGSCTLRYEIFPSLESLLSPTTSAAPLAYEQSFGSSNAPERRYLNRDQISFTLEALTEATDDFNQRNKLGEGGFGPVYKGTTRDGKQIAVKKLSARSAQGKKEFVNEVELVANIQHRNLVNLLGCCAVKTERLLVYEYLPNKSLDTFLFDPLKCRILDWQKRFNIIIGIARGLLYLHEDSQLRIIHRDIKANNILLDEQLNPKIADFGLARLFSDNETEIQSKVAGTYGYMAPEYAIGGHLSVKVDVYSFGVVLLEIVSGRKNNDINLSKEKQSVTLLEWAWRLFKEGHILKIVDTELVGSCVEEQVIRCTHIGLLCTQADPDVRPIMSSVVTMITTNTVPLPDPTRPAFVSMSSQSPNVSFTPSVSSRNEASISNLEPR